MIYITQLIYVKPGMEEVFHAFESEAIPLLKEYSGKIIQRIRPTQECFIEGEDLKPYEVHLVSFKSEDDLVAFSKDPRRAGFIHLKEESVSSILMYKGEIK